MAILIKNLPAAAAAAAARAAVAAAALLRCEIGTNDCLDNRRTMMLCRQRLPMQLGVIDRSPRYLEFRAPSEPRHPVPLAFR